MIKLNISLMFPSKLKIMNIYNLALYIFSSKSNSFISLKFQLYHKLYHYTFRKISASQLPQLQTRFHNALCTKALKFQINHYICKYEERWRRKERRRMVIVFKYIKVSRYRVNMKWEIYNELNWTAIAPIYVMRITSYTFPSYWILMSIAAASTTPSSRIHMYIHIQIIISLKMRIQKCSSEYK